MVERGRERGRKREGGKEREREKEREITSRADLINEEKREKGKAPPGNKMTLQTLSPISTFTAIRESLRKG